MIGSRSNVHDVQVLELPLVKTEVGSLVVCEKEGVLDWNPARTYFLYDIPNDSSRGGHAHKELCQLIVAVSGSFDVVLKDGVSERVVTLRSPQEGLMLPPGLWREIERFSGGAICLVLASHEYDELDYIRDWDQFLQFKGLSFN